MCFYPPFIPILDCPRRKDYRPEFTILDDHFPTHLAYNMKTGGEARADGAQCGQSITSNYPIVSIISVISIGFRHIARLIGSDCAPAAEVIQANLWVNVVLGTWSSA